MEPWKQCAQWLIHCKVLPANHRVTWDSAQVFDLAQTLRDGVLLCQLLNNLRARSINLKEINLRPQMSQRNHDIDEDSRKWRAFWYRYRYKNDTGQREEKGVPRRGSPESPLSVWPAGKLGGGVYSPS